jgi:uncharacterized protein (TIGR00255 family)
MICSMTAFSSKEQHQEDYSLTWEIRSVNHRYLEPGFKLPDSFNFLEPILRDKLKQHVARGKFDCSLKYQPVSAPRAGLDLNREMLEDLLDVDTTLRSQAQNLGPINPLELLQWPGMLQQHEADKQAVGAIASSLFEVALRALIDTRQREGAELAAFIGQRLDAIAVQVDNLRSRLPEILTNQRQRLVAKLEEISADLDHNRLEQELVYALQKADVDEELDRLSAHVGEVRRILSQGKSCGRRLDFLMQELNREANTLSSKSLTADTTMAAVELKVLIEQMREQVQNIE